MSNGLLDMSDEVIDIVSDWAVEMIEEVTKALTPSGKPFGHEDEPFEELAIKYVALRGNPEAWLSFIEEKAEQITTKLQESGVSPGNILAVHPYDIAAKYAVNYSAYMEEELRKRE